MEEKHPEWHWPLLSGSVFNAKQQREGATYDWFVPGRPGSAECGRLFWQLSTDAGSVSTQRAGFSCSDILPGLIQAVFCCYCRRNLNTTPPPKRRGVDLMTSETGGPPMSDSRAEGTVDENKWIVKVTRGRGERRESVYWRNVEQQRERVSKYCYQLKITDKEENNRDFAPVGKVKTSKILNSWAIAIRSYGIYSLRSVAFYVALGCCFTRYAH